MTTPADPFAMFRDAMAQWEKIANEHGSKLLARPEAAQAMQGVTSAGLQMQAAHHETMSKVLAASNMPSKADIDAIGERLARIEAALARIESGNVATPDPVPRPARTRRPALR